jgi:subtilisin family serine protease
MTHHKRFVALALAIVASLLLATVAGAVVEIPTLTDGPGDAAPPAASPRLIVELSTPPLAVAYKDQVGAAAANGSLNTQSTFATAYVAQLQAEQAAFVSVMEQAVPTARVSAFLNEAGVDEQATYQVAFNGLAVEVGAADQAAAREALAKLPGVKAVYTDRLYTTQLYTSTALINAPVVWNQLGGRANAGANVKVASMDGGAYYAAPMFDGTGYTYPPGYGPNGLGLTANNNGKIIVSRAYYRTWDPPVADDNTPWPGPAGTSHGVHTTSTAAGNVVTATYGGTLVGQISGVAPRAHVMSYKVFYESVNGNSGFYTAEGLAALEDIVLDGADVVNNSWGGGPGSEGGEFDALDTALTNAFDAGVFVSMSAGNSGPGNGTTDHPSPSYISVAASTTGGTYASGNVSVPSQVALQDINFSAAGFGAPLSIGQLFTYTVLPGASVNPANINGCNPWPAGAFTGKAALIQRGTCEFGVKVLNAELAGASFVVVYNSAAGGDALINMGPGAVGSQVTISSIFIGRTDGVGVIAAYNSDPTTQLVVSTLAFQAGETPDRIVAFSSRGPGVGNTLKPDIAAPGSNILAQGYTPGATGMDVFTGYGQASGTSMASPHVAGAAALVRQAHPSWPNSWIKSALMSTSKYMDIYNFDETPAQPLDMGAGRLDLTNVTNPGVILDPPSLSFSVVPTGTTKTISVTVISVASAAETYNVGTLYTGAGFTQTTALPGFSASPAQITLQPGQSAVLAVTFDPATSQGYGDNQGYILLDGATHDAHMPAWARVAYDVAFADVLVIDNDFSDLVQDYDYLWYYTSTLETLGLSYEVWNVDDYAGSDRTIPDATTLAAFPHIVHFTGDNYQPDGTFTVHTGLTALDLDSLTEYVNGGGKYVAMGQDYSGAMTDDSFFYNYRLGAAYIQDSVTNGAQPNQLILPTSSAPALLGRVRVDLTQTRKYESEGDLEGSQEVPPVVTNTTGGYTLRYDVTRKLLEIQVTVTPTTTTPITVTAAHIHEGVAGANGPVLFTLFTGPTLVTSTLTFDGSFTLSAAQEAALLSDGLYVNVHTDVNPGGHVRSQITPTALPNQRYVDELDNMLHDGSSNPNPVPGDPFGETTLGSNPLLSYSGPFNDYNGDVTLARRQQPSLEVPGITYAGRSIFASFGLEGMSETFNASYGITPTSRAGLLGAFVVWLNTEPGTVTITPTLVATTTLYTFGYAFTSNPQNPVATSPVHARWDFGDGTPYVTAGDANTASHQYVCAADNVHTVRVEITDSLGIVTLGEVTIDVSGSCNVGPVNPTGIYLPIIGK